MSDDYEIDMKELCNELNIDYNENNEQVIRDFLIIKELVFLAREGKEDLGLIISKAFHFGKGNITGKEALNFKKPNHLSLV